MDHLGIDKFMVMGFVKAARLIPPGEPIRDECRGMVSPEGIDHGKARPQADAVWLISSGEP
jgi:hypothetical protein